MLLLITSGFFGLLIGSFLNVIILRMPIMLLSPAPGFNLMIPRSHCPNCKNLVQARDNIPLVSYLLLWGQCRSCTQPIPLRYPLIELLTACLTMLTVFHFGYTPHAGCALILVWSLIILSFIDIDHMILPDDISLPILWLGLFLNTFAIFTPLQDAVLGAIGGYLSLWTVYWIFKLITQKEGMGYGDFKLLALLGAWLGWQALPVIVFIASLLGSVIGLILIAFKKYNRASPMPFGPYLALAGLIALFCYPI